MNNVLEVESAVVDMYTAHPSPGYRNKLGFASQRTALRLYCCGVTEEDYVGKKVLDAGCGTGEYSSWFAARGAHVTGIDLAEGALREAQEYTASAGLDNVRFEKRSVLQTGFPAGSFDFVYCTGVLHHTPDPFAGFVELCRVLRPGGKILISLYNVLGFFPREVRRRVALLLGGKDLDRRVRWGRRLFPFTVRRLTKDDRYDSQSALYDYFAIPHETLHSIGQVLRWLDRCGLEYMGSFAPACLRDYSAMFAHEAYLAVEEEFQSGIGRRLGRLSRSAKMLRARPGVLSRGLVQMMWLVRGLGAFCMCARRPAW